MSLKGLTYAYNLFLIIILLLQSLESLVNCCKLSEELWTKCCMCMLALLAVSSVSSVKLNVTCDQHGSVNTSSLPPLCIPLGLPFAPIPPPLPFLLLHLLFLITPHLSWRLTVSQLGETVTPPSSPCEKKWGLLVSLKDKPQKAHSHTQHSTKGSHFHNWLSRLTFKRRPILFRLEAINNTAWIKH